jgi:hypothetical protein
MVLKSTERAIFSQSGETQLLHNELQTNRCQPYATLLVENML